MDKYEAMKRDLLDEFEDDHVSLRSVIGYVEDEMPNATEDAIRNHTLDLLYEFLKSNSIRAGVPDSNGRDFHEWPFAADVVIDRIKSLWKSNTRPKPGEIAWFTAPSRSLSSAHASGRP